MNGLIMPIKNRDCYSGLKTNKTGPNYMLSIRNPL